MLKSSYLIIRYYVNLLLLTTFIFAHNIFSFHFFKMLFRVHTVIKSTEVYGPTRKYTFIDDQYGIVVLYERKLNISILPAGRTICDCGWRD